MRCAAMPTPGKFFGHVVTIFQRILPAAMAGAATAVETATDPAAAPFRNARLLLRFFVTVSPSLETRASEFPS